MRDKEYSKWLQAYVTNAVIVDYIKRCQRVENNLHIDLDNEFCKDKGASLLAKLTYTTDDQVKNRPLKCNIYFKVGSDLRTGMCSLKTAVSKYFEFCQNEVTPTVVKSVMIGTVKKDMIPTIIDSYQEFLTHFQIDRKSFFEWGISATIFPSTDKVALEWEDLKKRIFNNQTVYIRGYGRDAHGTQLYKEFYEKLLGNSHIEKDPTNNTIPHKLIQRTTELKRNSDIYNYQVSHIWGHTKNVFMFEAPWNICYTPKIMDPFTGHETKGIWPTEYQKLFITKAYELYRPFINEYNQILKSLDIKKQLQEYISSQNGNILTKKLTQFSNDVIDELSPII